MEQLSLARYTVCASAYTKPVFSTPGLPAVGIHCTPSPLSLSLYTINYYTHYTLYIQYNVVLLTNYTREFLGILKSETYGIGLKKY